MELVFTEVEEVEEVWLLLRIPSFHLEHTQWWLVMVVAHIKMEIIQHLMAALRLVVDEVVVKEHPRQMVHLVDLVEEEHITVLVVLEHLVKVMMVEMVLLEEVMPLVEVVVQELQDRMLQIIPLVVMVETELLG